jgi:hypothetical protein
MVGLGWTDPSFFTSEEDGVALQHAIARYHAYVHPSRWSRPADLESDYRFLDLMSSSPASFFVPTLDIDLAWHTHQLTPKNYHADCKKYLGRYIDQ